MGQTIYTEIEITRAPAEVRKVFLDFPKYSEWHTGFGIESSKPVVEKGDKLKVDASGSKFNPVVLENSPEQFRWHGSIPLLFSGEHRFRFESSQKTPGGTTLVQSEEFSGLLSFLVGPTWSMGQNITRQFQSFNESLKKRVEAQ